MNCRTLLTALVALALLTGCAKTYDLTFTVAEGMSNRYISEDVTITTTQAMGTDMENITTNKLTFVIDDAGVDEDNHERVKFSYEAVEYEQSIMGNSITYSSTDPSRNNNPEIARVYSSLLGQSMIMVFNPNGEILDVEGVEEIMNSMFESLPDEYRATMEEQFGGESLVSAMKSMTNYYPEKGKVKIGDTWSVTNEFALGGMEMIIDSNFRLVEVKDGLAKLAFDGEVTSNPEAPGLNLMGMQMQFDLQGTQQGTLYIDANTRWLESMEVDQQFDGFMNMNSEQTGPMKLDMAVESQQLIRKITP